MDLLGGKRARPLVLDVGFSSGLAVSWIDGFVMRQTYRQ